MKVYELNSGPIALSCQFEKPEFAREQLRACCLVFVQSLENYLSRFEWWNDVEELELGVMLAGDECVYSLNSEYRQKNSVTDVLSFPLNNDLWREGWDASEGPILALGDIFICHSVCAKQALQFSMSYEEEFIHLLIHGVLHLLGLDHEVSLEEEQLMEQEERELFELMRPRLQALNLGRGHE